MKWLLLLLVVDAGGHRSAYDPAVMDWWSCRKTELRIAAGYRGRYAGQEVVGAACIRVDRPVQASCRSARGCA